MRAEVCSIYRKLTASHGAYPCGVQVKDVKFPSEAPIQFSFFIIITAHRATYVGEYMNCSYD